MESGNAQPDPIRRQGASYQVGAPSATMETDQPPAMDEWPRALVRLPADRDVLPNPAS